jgi:hypothetical protein
MSVNAQLRIRARRHHLDHSKTAAKEEKEAESLVEFLVFVDPTSLLFLGYESLEECCRDAIQAASNESELFEYVSYHVELIDTILFDSKEFRSLLIRHID